MLQKLKPLFVDKKLKEKKMYIFSPLEFRRVFNVSEYASGWFIKTYTQKGLFKKLRNGLYILSDIPYNHYLIANKVYNPSYISFETAFSFHKIIPETIYSITSATPKTSREFDVLNNHYVYRKIKKNVYTGYSVIKYLNETVLMAEAEKALADFLYFVDLGKQEMSYERLDLSNIKKNKFFKYIDLFNRKSLNKLAKEIYDEYR
ncbi:MAG: hypothetical protein ABIA91_02510 [Patescibacteria group bacterium]